ncbi:class E sortase [Streptomyces sp. NPDC054841]
MSPTDVAAELLITVGLMVALFLVYEVWWTGLQSSRNTEAATADIVRQWAERPQLGASQLPRRPSPGEIFAIVHLPSLGVRAPIAEGVNKRTVLDKGQVGHYPGGMYGVFPWEPKGNFAVAAHRTTHGEPFRNLDRLKPGDTVVVETAAYYYTYMITSRLEQTPPSNVSVLDPVPAGAGFQRPGRYLTMTTCTPPYSVRFRLVVWGRLVDERPRGDGKPTALQQS